MYWKMSIDLRRPLVASMGQHDPLDGLITCLELRSDADTANDCLSPAIKDFEAMCEPANWETEDPLGIGGVLDAAARFARLISQQGAPQHELLEHLLRQAVLSLQRLGRAAVFAQPAHYRLAFRELGLSIGLHAFESAAQHLIQDRNLAQLSHRVLAHRALCKQIEDFWLTPMHRNVGTWVDHEDINTVMLAASLLH